MSEANGIEKEDVSPMEANRRLEKIKHTKVYSKETRVPVNTTSKTRCVDGRYMLAKAGQLNENGELVQPELVDQVPEYKETGTIARPGGDFGYVLVLFDIMLRNHSGLTPEECFDAVYDFKTERNVNFSMHTDRHADPDDTEHHEGEKPLLGCGHGLAPTSLGWAAKYLGVDIDTEEGKQLAEKFSEGVKQLIAYARERVDRGDKIDLVNIKEPTHAEIDVLIVKGTKYTVNPSDGKEQHFIYDEGRDQEEMRNLGDWLEKRRALSIGNDTIIGTSGKHTGAILKKLALDKDILSVNADNEEPEVEYLGKVA